jgi:hypothetical protein
MSFGIPVRNGLSIGLLASTFLTSGSGRLVPRLTLNFLTGAPLDSRITFTRSTTATFVGSNGLIQTAAIDAPRFDYNPVTLAPNGLLIEEQRVNSLLYSDQFQQASWGKGDATVTANATTSPDGTINADKLIAAATSTNAHQVSSPAINFVAGTTYVFSCYMKAGEYLFGNLLLPSAAFTANQVGSFDLVNGLSLVSVGAPIVSISNAGNGWWRVSVAATATTTAVGIIAIRVNSTFSNNVYTGDGTSGIFLYGAQVEAGAFATSYIPTVASTVTRAVDVALMTGTNFSSWYNASEGTLVTSALPIVSSVSKYSWSFNDGTGTELIAQYFLNVNAGGFVVDNGSTQAQIEAGTFSGVCKTAFAYKINDFALSLNGGTVTTDTVGTIPTTTQAQIGNRPDGSRTMNGYIRTLTYYPSRLTNAQLQALTT